MTNLFKEWVSEIDKSSLGNKLGRNASLSLLGVLASHCSTSAAARGTAGTRTVRTASNGTSSSRTRLAASTTALTRSSVFSFSNTLRHRSVIFVTVVVGLSNLDVVVILIVVSARWRQSSALGQRNRLVGRRSVFITEISRIPRTNILAASRSWVFLTMVEESGSAVICVER